MDFLKNNKRFSFKIDDVNAWDLDFKKQEIQEENTLTTVYDFESGIRITNIAKKYDDFGGYEWINYIENTSDKATKIISELWDCDCTLPMEYEEERKESPLIPDKKTATKVYAPNGSYCMAKEFYCDVDDIFEHKRLNHITVGETKKYSASNGRSSAWQAPFFNVSKNDCGYIFAIGWTGQWNCELKREKESITIKTKVEDTHFCLFPKEKIRTSSIVIMPYSNGFVNAHNNWRRFVKKHFSLIGQEGRGDYAPTCAMVWGGLKSEKVLERVKYIDENNLPFEYIWMDAGWYGKDAEPGLNEFEGDWASHLGDWCVSPIIHKNGLLDVSEEIHKSGRKFVLWFEPERAYYNSSLVLEHPEYFLSTDIEWARHCRLLNLGNEDAWSYCYNTVSGLIEKLHIDCYRQDFNFWPLRSWRSNDSFDRVGMTEIKHINGLYKLWDCLLEKFPNLIIDDCSSGGKRIDVEMLRRGVPMWRSDFTCVENYDIEGTQNHGLTYNLWMPYSGSGVGRTYDEYRLRSSYASTFVSSHFFSETENEKCKNPENIKMLKKYMEEYIKVRPYFDKDFYPLTEVTNTTDVWCAMQFDNPEENDGILRVFRRENSPYETSVFYLYGIKEDKDYLFTDADGGEFTVSGKDLKENGLKLTIKEKRKAKLYFYKTV